MMSKTLEFAAGFVLYRHSKEFENAGSKGLEFLLLQASYEPYHWSCPKGHLEGTEKPMQAAIRETEEECGLKVSENFEIVDGFELNLNYPVKDKMKTVHYYLGKVNNETVQIILSNEHKAFKWLNLEDALSLVNYENSKKLLNSAHEYILKHEKDL